jgi:hypothetical protein
VSQLILPRRFNRQPQGAVEIDTANAFGAHIVGGFCGKIIIAGSPASQPKYTVNNRGIAVQQNTYNNSGFTVSHAQRTVKSVVFSAKHISTSYGYPGYFSPGEANTSLFATGTQLVARKNGVDRYSGAGLLDVSQTRAYQIAVSTSSNTFYYRSGTLFSALAANSDMGFLTGSTTYLGNVSSARSIEVDYFYLLDVDLESSGLVGNLGDLQNNPWQIFRAKPRVLYFDVGGGGTTHATTGALIGQGSTITGSSARLRAFATSGVLVGQGATIAGAAARTRLHATTGALTGSGSTLSGAANRLRAFATTGALTGSGTTVDGQAQNGVGAVTHDTTGALTGSGTTVAGTATRDRLHASTGVLTGSGVSLSGTAARTRVHATTGNLVGSGTTVAGIGNRTHAFVTSGVLSGGEAIIVGSAARIGAPISHATSGGLFGDGATVVGSAARISAGVTLSQEDIDAIADAVWSHATALDFADKMLICSRILRNKTVTDPVTGVMTVYADDGTTPYLTAQLHEDVSETQTYRGQGAEVRARLQ